MYDEGLNPVCMNDRIVTLMATRSRRFLCLCALVVPLTGTAHAQANEPSETGAVKMPAVDCTDVHVDYEDDPTLTKEERLVLMERAFYRSLSRFDACRASVTGTSSTSTASGGANAGGMEGSETGDSEGEGTGISAAASDMSGSETTSAGETNGIIEPAGDVEQSDSTATGQDQPGTGEAKQQRLNDGNNGKVPEDIPEADNDSVLEAQIRRAAIAATDPEMKKRLWNEYRKYKGLPQVN